MFFISKTIKFNNSQFFYTKKAAFQLPSKKQNSLKHYYPID